MRVFVLCTGRCGSLTFHKACSHLTNFTAGHETNAANLRGRLRYPDQHIEVDNRLSWFLGSLERTYGDEPVYVHLQRDYESVLDSYKRRLGAPGIVSAFAHGIVINKKCDDYEKATRLMLDTVRDNIDAFLANKTKVIRMRIERPHEPFDRLMRLIGAEGDLDAAHAELDVRHHARRGRRK